jgi:hypothetical protein
MRSFDYCHFECTLSSDEPQTLDEIDGTRKAAAVLVDEAIRQYRIAKTKEYARNDTTETIKNKLKLADQLRKKEEHLTPEEAAFMKSVAERQFWATLDEDSYYYRDEERDFHFSMLEQFKKARILV